MTEQGEHWVTVEQAANLLGKSSRTIFRWSSSGRLPSEKRGARLFVDVADELPEEADAALPVADRVRGLELQVETLTVVNERLTSELTYLRQKLDESQTLLAITLQSRRPAIEAPTRRPWWQFWQPE